MAYPDETWTWEDFYEAAKAITDAGQGSTYGYSIDVGNNQDGWWNIVYDYGGYVISEDHKTSGMDDPKTLEAMEFLGKLIADTMPAQSVISENGGQESGTGSEEDLPNREVRKLVRRFISGRELERFYRQWWGNIDEKRARHEILLYFQKLWETLLLFLPEQTEEQTIVQKIFGINKGLYTSDENIFLFKGMQYLCKCSEELSAKAQISIQDEQTVRCILQYLRVKHSVFGRTVQKKTIRGLDYFQNEFYNRNSKMNQYYSAVSAGLVPGEERTTYWELAMRKQFQNRELKKIEFRASVNENEAGFRKEVRAYEKARDSGQQIYEELEQILERL